MSLPTVEEVKNYLRIDGAEDDSFLGSLIDVAEEDLMSSGIKNQETARYKLAALLLIANHYEERRPEVIGTSVAKNSYSLERIILQLKAEELPLDSELEEIL
ncbi:head-tail connector protein [Virgibacillus salexigens]|uniref:Putative phage protein (Possible DNA packaging) n=1 Tax=Virgibacillus massiliensis TaxID=1462526 RepID=A0A024QBI7_9BACI|nr:head-tail connector protein [Virgibacillus massiliensis]CDQ39550.1 putative phage protein (possible DNA packaging) [Virgibacillus massiliensis]